MFSVENNNLFSVNLSGKIQVKKRYIFYMQILIFLYYETVLEEKTENNIFSYSHDNRNPTKAEKLETLRILCI